MIYRFDEGSLRGPFQECCRVSKRLCLYPFRDSTTIRAASYWHPSRHRRPSIATWTWITRIWVSLTRHRSKTLTWTVPTASSSLRKWTRWSSCYPHTTTMSICKELNRPTKRWNRNRTPALTRTTSLTPPPPHSTSLHSASRQVLLQIAGRMPVESQVTCYPVFQYTEGTLRKKSISNQYHPISLRETRQQKKK